MNPHTTFNPDMLTLGREVRGASVTALSRAAKVPTKRIRAYEDGLEVPTLETVERLAAALRRPVSFFYRSGQRYGGISVHYASSKD